METSYPRFLAGIHQEHADEASFLYEQCVALRASQALPWPALDDFEQRLEAHLDALVVAGSPGLALACRSVVPDEPGTLHTAVSLACRQQRADTLAGLLARLDTACDAPGVTAAVDALAAELPGPWTPFVDAALRRQPRLVPLLAHVAGRRRLPVAEALQAALGQAGEDATEALVTALGRLGQSASRPCLERHLNHPRPAIRQAALLALLRTGDAQALRPWHANTVTEAWPVPALALAGDGQVVPQLAGLLAHGLEPGACLAGLGQLGDPAALQWLYDALKVPDRALAAALALDRMTGAALQEDGFQPEPVDEAELFDDELQAWRERGQRPLRGDGRPYGEAVRTLSMDRTRWSPWLQQHVARFQDGQRYRRGQLCDPLVLCAELQDPRSGAAQRQSAADELAIRYGCPVAFQASMRVAAQQAALADMDAWATAQRSRFRPGGWYLAGQPQGAEGTVPWA